MRNLRTLVPFLLLAFLFSASLPLAAQDSAGDPAALGAGDDWSGVVKTRWSDPDSHPMTYEEYVERYRPGGPFEIASSTTYPSARRGAGSGLYVIIVNSDLQPLIQTALDEYVGDVLEEGYTVTVLGTSGGTPVDIRTTLQQQQASGLIGALLIGDLPVPWFEVSGATFPCDLFYMDLDGDWSDNNANSVYDLHVNNETPEIFVGRLTAKPLYGLGMGTEEGKVIKYFGKIHDYRSGLLSVNYRALAYPDDDWSYFKACGLNNLYDDVVVINDKAVTTGEDYKIRLTENYEWIHVCVHSWPQGHSFNPTGTVTFWDVKNIDPRAQFYNLFACSNCRYVETDYQGGWYIFADTYGLAAVGSTKSGSMLDFKSFYDPLGRHETLGRAFVEWWIAQHPYSIGDQEWFYGMTLLGDPLLVPAESQLIKATPNTLSAAAGGVVNLRFELNEMHYAERQYQVLVSSSGTSPRTPHSGLLIPLVFDRVTSFAFQHTNDPSFRWFRGNLDWNGDGGSRLSVPSLDPQWVGKLLDFCVVIVDPADYVSRPVSVQIVP